MGYPKGNRELNRGAWGYGHRANPSIYWKRSKDLNPNFCLGSLFGPFT